MIIVAMCSSSSILSLFIAITTILRATTINTIFLASSISTFIPLKHHPSHKISGNAMSPK
eukprot:m.35852 g.35852  ORF g.35852 m.35852 type:complete len:60 (+) comp17213_c1_seq1:1373-1552(+)